MMTVMLDANEQGPFWDHMYRHSHKWMGMMQARRGDMKPMILSLLKESPMHGYEIIRTLEERSRGMWRPSPGSIYPMLQLLEDEGLVGVKTQNGKKTYSLTEAGTKEAAEVSVTAPWENKRFHSVERLELRKSIYEAMMALRKIAVHGTDEQLKKSAHIIKTAAEQLNQLTSDSK